MSLASAVHYQCQCSNRVGRIKSKHAIVSPVSPVPLPKGRHDYSWTFSRCLYFAYDRTDEGRCFAITEKLSLGSNTEPPILTSVQPTHTIVTSISNSLQLIRLRDVSIHATVHMNDVLFRERSGHTFIVVHYSSGYPTRTG